MSSLDLAVEFGNINEANLEQLRKLNISIFPVRYNDKFYQNVLLTRPEVTQVRNMCYFSKNNIMSACFAVCLLEWICRGCNLLSP